MDAKYTSWAWPVLQAVGRGLKQGLRQAGFFSRRAGRRAARKILPQLRDHGVSIAAVLFVLLVIVAMYWGAPQLEMNQPPNLLSSEEELTGSGELSPLEEDVPLLPVQPEKSSHAAAVPATDWGMAPAGGPALTFPVPALLAPATEPSRLVPDANDGPHFLIQTYVPSEPPALSADCVWLTGTIED